MRLKATLVFISIMAVGLSNNCPSLALAPEDSVSEKYLIDHGHSQEIVRMINLQRTRAEGKSLAPAKSEGPFKKFFKNLWYEQDLTLPVTDFGYNNVKTPETSKDVVVPKQISEPIKNLVNKKNDTKSNEININNVKVRETK